MARRAVVLLGKLSLWPIPVGVPKPGMPQCRLQVQYDVGTGLGARIRSLGAGGVEVANCHCSSARVFGMEAARVLARFDEGCPGYSLSNEVVNPSGKESTRQTTRDSHDTSSSVFVVIISVCLDPHYA